MSLFNIADDVYADITVGYHIDWTQHLVDGDITSDGVQWGSTFTTTKTDDSY